MNLDSLTRISVPLQFEGTEYFLLELSGEEAITYRDAMVAAAVVDEETGEMKRIDPKAYSDLQYTLVSLGLRRKGTDGALYPVSLDTVKTWPNRILKALADKIREISELVAKEEDDADPQQPGEQLDTESGPK